MPGTSDPSVSPELRTSLDRARAAFADRYRRPATAAASAPGRVNLIGEHTDYNRGLCLPMALQQRTVVALAPREDTRVRVVSGAADGIWETDLAEYDGSVLAGWGSYAAGVVWARAAADGTPVRGYDVAVESTVPLGGGLSSSAALECALALALDAEEGVPDSTQRRSALVTACIRAESDTAGAPTGGMDQTVVLHARRGHALAIDFADGGLAHVPVAFAAHGLRLLVVDTRVSHALTDGGYAARRRECERAAALLGVRSLREATPADLVRIPEELPRRRARHVVNDNLRVAEVQDLLREGRWQDLGAVLTRSHASLRDDFEVSCPESDSVVEAGLAAGALGGRMVGGGFGGSVLLLVPEPETAQVVARVRAAFEERGWREPAVLDPGEGGAGAQVHPV